MTIDLTKSQIFWTDIEWLGVGSVRTGFILDGRYIICHIFNHANFLKYPYMTSAIGPVRYEITNTTGTAPASNLMQICSTVISEGGYDQQFSLHSNIALFQPVNDTWGLVSSDVNSNWPQDIWMGLCRCVKLSL